MAKGIARTDGLETLEGAKSLDNEFVRQFFYTARA